LSFDLKVRFFSRLTYGRICRRLAFLGVSGGNTILSIMKTLLKAPLKQYLISVINEKHMSGGEDRISHIKLSLKR
jgi:hypothetical protein